LEAISKRVLCIDDDAAILRLHQRLLEDAGYSVLTAASGELALSMLEQGALADIAVLDYSMPGMDGEELSQQLRKRYPKLRLVAASGNELPPAMIEALDGHMLKGRHPEQIVSVVSEVLAESKEPAEEKNSSSTILCVEDEELQLRLREMLLESAGFKVFGARTAKEAMEIFRSNHIDAVVMDYWLSVENGTAIAEQMKALRPRTPVVMLSGFSSLPGEGAVVDAWLRKAEIQPEDLIREVTRLVRLRKDARRAAISE
jgi:two-component system NtrC family sensor kinase